MLGIGLLGLIIVSIAVFAIRGSARGRVGWPEPLQRYYCADCGASFIHQHGVTMHRRWTHDVVPNAGIRLPKRNRDLGKRYEEVRVAGGVVLKVYQGHRR